MRMHHMTFPEAVRHLAVRYGVEIPERPLSPEEKRRREEREGLIEVNELAAAFFRSSLDGRSGDAARGRELVGTQIALSDDELPCGEEPSEDEDGGERLLRRGPHDDNPLQISS